MPHYYLMSNYSLSLNNSLLMKFLSIFTLLFLLFACGDEVVTFKTDKERYSYLLGVEIAKPFIAQAPFTKMDKEKMIEGFENPVKEAELKKFYRDLELLLGQTGRSFNEKYKNKVRLPLVKSTASALTITLKNSMPKTSSIATSLKKVLPMVSTNVMPPHSKASIAKKSWPVLKPS